MQVDIASDLSEWIASLDINAISKEARFAAAVDLLDTVGCALAGHDADGIVAVRRRAAHWSGANDCSVWGTDVRLNCPDAALVNASAAHALEFDDTHDSAVLHAGAAVCAAALATAESVGEVSGTELIAAIVAGIETSCRIAKAVSVGPGVSGWLLTPLAGYFGAAAAAGRVLRLNATEIRHALGIAYSQTAGNGQATLDGALTKRLQPGFAARGGVVSAWLAADGVTGASNVFEGQRGYFGVYHGGNYDRNEVLDGLGDRFSICELSFKAYPTCRWTHAVIDAGRTIFDRGTNPSLIDKVVIEVNEQAFRSSGTPIDLRRRPRKTHEAQFSIPYTFAVAATRGDVVLQDLATEALNDPQVLALAARVETQTWTDEPIGSSRGITGTRVTTRSRDGTSTVDTVSEPHAFSATDADLPSLLQKFETCCAFGGVNTPSGFADSILSVEQCEDVARVMDSIVLPPHDD